MSNIVAYAIAERVITIMLGEEAFDALKVIYLGIPTNIPAELFPAAIVTVESEQEATAQSGNLTATAYVGSVSFHVRGADNPVVTARKAVVPSYLTVMTYANALKQIFRVSDDGHVLRHQWLDELKASDDSWAVNGFYIADGGAVEYGFPMQTERKNNFENFSTVPFICTVQE